MVRMGSLGRTAGATSGPHPGHERPDRSGQQRSPSGRQLPSSPNRLDHPPQVAAPRPGSLTRKRSLRLPRRLRRLADDDRGRRGRASPIAQLVAIAATPEPRSPLASRALPVPKLGPRWGRERSATPGHQRTTAVSRRPSQRRCRGIAAGPGSALPALLQGLGCWVYRRVSLASVRCYRGSRGLSGGRSHSDALVGCTVWLTTASSSAERASRSTCSRSRAANPATVRAAS